MELLQIISEQTPAMALAITILWFYNRDSLKYLQERREMIESIRTERREWLESIRVLTVQYNELLAKAVTEMVRMSSEMHALRGKLTEWMLGVEARRTPRQGDSSSD